jgi:hypothetical protein
MLHHLLLTIIAAAVFITEAGIMILLLILPPLPHAVAAPLDAALVTIVIFPILYRFVVHPMTLHINERERAEAALRRIQDDLEVRVQQRTAELARANETLQVQVAERQRAGEELKVALDLVQQRQAEMAALLTGARAVLEYRDFAAIAQAIFEACRSTIGAAGHVACPPKTLIGESRICESGRTSHQAGHDAVHADGRPAPASLRDRQDYLHERVRQRWRCAVAARRTSAFAQYPIRAADD